MRLLITVLIWILLVGGLWLYMSTRPEITAPEKVEELISDPIWSLEIVTTFPTEPDPYTVSSEGIDEQISILLQLNGKIILRKNEIIERCNPIKIDLLQGLKKGENEFYIEAFPPVNETEKQHALRVIILKSGNKQSEHSFWSDGTGKIAGTFALLIDNSPPGREVNE